MLFLTFIFESYVLKSTTGGIFEIINRQSLEYSFLNNMMLLTVVHLKKKTIQFEIEFSLVSHLLSQIFCLVKII